jgi:hypothetical protein
MGRLITKYNRNTNSNPSCFSGDFFFLFFSEFHWNSGTK